MSRNDAFESGKAAKANAVASGKEYAFESPYSREQDLMVGGKNSPGGANSASVTSFPGLTVVRMYKGKKNIGTVEAVGGEVKHIQTASDYKRQGVATEAFRLANFAHGRGGGEEAIKHSATRTPSGDAWAKSTGGRLPKLDASGGIIQSRLFDRD